MAWTLVNKTPNTNLGYSYYPAAWEDSGKVYVKAQGELEVNIYDVATDTWGTPLTLPATSLYQLFGSVAIRHELLWVANSKLYVLATGSAGFGTGSDVTVASYNLTTGSFDAAVTTTAFGSTIGSPSYHGDWGRNRHKAVVKEPVSGRVFLINFYLRKVYEFLPTTEAFVLVKTWTETIGGNATDDAAGCDAVALNGMIYLLGTHSYDYSNGGTAGPVEVNILDWTSSVKANYPDYGNINSDTYNHYCDTSWAAIGNNVYGYGGRMRGSGGADGDNAGARGDIMRRIEFDTGANIWTDLGTIPVALLYASTIVNGNSGYLFGGYEGGTATQKTGNLIYLLEAVDTMALAYDPANDSVTITWTDTSGQALTGYLVERREQQSSTWTTVGSGAAADRTMTDTTAIIGHDYYYQVRPYYVQVS